MCTCISDNSTMECIESDGPVRECSFVLKCFSGQQNNLFSPHNQADLWCVLCIVYTNNDDFYCHTIIIFSDCLFHPLIIK